MVTTMATMMAMLAVTGPGMQPVKAGRAQPEDAGQAVQRSMYDLREMRGDIHLTGESDPLDDLVGMVMGEYIGIGHGELLEGIYLVEGTQAEIDQADEMIRGLRAAMARSYVVRIECWTVPAESPVSVGRPLPSGGEAIHWYEGVVGARRQTRIAAVTEQSYIEDWQPVVSDNAVGYDSQSATVESGLSAELLVGAVENDMVLVRFHGLLQQATVREREVLMGGGLEGARLPLGSPQVTRRMLDCDTQIPLGESVVLQTLPGFERGQTLALVVRVVPSESAIPQRGGRR